MTKMPMEQFKEITEKCGFKYGPTFSIIKAIWKRDNEGLCLVDISESDTIKEETASYIVHPSILDACLQSCFVPLASFLTVDKPIVPIGFKSIILYDVPATSQLYCHVVSDTTEFGRFDVTLMSSSGSVLLTMNDFRVSELTSSARRQLAFDELAYEVHWKEEELKGQRESTTHLTCIVLQDSSNFSDNLVARLHTSQVNVITVNPPDGSCFNEESEKAILAVLSDVPTHNLSKLRVINLWPLEASLLPDKFEVIEKAQHLVFRSSAFLLRQLVEKKSIDPRLFLVTERTQLLHDCGNSLKMTSFPWGSTAWGLRRTTDHELFNIRVTAVDLCNKEDQQELDSLVSEILCDSIEDEVAFQGKKRFTNRLLRSTPHQKKSALTVKDGHKKIGSLYLSTIPSSRTLCLRERSCSRPSHSEVLIDVHYCWNLSESLYELSKPNGCVFVSGKVTHLPEKSQHNLRIGDEVCGVIQSGRVGRSIPIDAKNAFLKPASLTKEQATCIPACLSIASYGLQRATSGAQNQKLLIHEANLGPGPAAIVLGKTLGHRVSCTISDTCKTSTKTLLFNLGAESVRRQSSPLLKDDSIDLFDAVIFFSTPSPNALNRSGHSLKKGGRVIVLSAQFYGDVVFPANKNVEYLRNDISDILLVPLAFEKLTLESLEMMEGKGVLKQLLEMKIESADLVSSIRAANGLTDRKASRRREVEEYSDLSLSIKSLATFDEESHLQDIAVLRQGLDECGLKDNRTYLVAGGLGGFGFEVACWMAENGAKTIGLLSRSKPSDAKRQELWLIEKRTGTKIHTFQVGKVYLSGYLLFRPPSISFQIP